MTCEGLFNGQTGGNRVWLWTFTFAVLHDDWECSRLFRRFLNHLRVVLGKEWGGVRVAELHKEHGVHYHALVTRRIPVDIIRRVGRCHGIGRVHVALCDSNAPKYLGKYLSKSLAGPLGEGGRSGRRWAAFGNIVRTRVSDLVNESSYWVFRRSRGLKWLGYKSEIILQAVWSLGESNFLTAWHCAKGGNVGALYGLACGHMEMMGGLLVTRLRQEVRSGAFSWGPY